MSTCELIHTEREIKPAVQVPIEHPGSKPHLSLTPPVQVPIAPYILCLINREPRLQQWNM